MHSLEYFPKENCLIVSCGRNDSDRNMVLNDLWLLKLGHMEWQQVIKYKNGSINGRFNHCSVIMDEVMIIAGGIGEQYKYMKNY